VTATTNTHARRRATTRLSHNLRTGKPLENAHCTVQKNPLEVIAVVLINLIERNERKAEKEKGIGVCLHKLLIAID
jgi:hypothetical protein